MSFRTFSVTVAVAAWVGTSAAAPVQLTNAASPYLQDFDTLARIGTSSSLPTGWAFTEIGANANTTYNSRPGDSNSGDTYSFGGIPNTDRALGSLRNGSLVSLFGVEFQNLSGSAIASLTIAYTGELWRLGATGRTTPDRLDFQYSLDATSLTSGTWIDVDALDFIAPSTATNVGARNGNAAANRTALSATISGLASGDGASFWLRWSDFDASGADDGLAIDDFSLRFANATSNAVPEPGSLALAGIALLGFVGLGRRRS